jgi:LmbE family N-acetylglucosaminyl deacetylase
VNILYRFLFLHLSAFIYPLFATHAQPLKTRSATASEIRLNMNHVNRFGSVLYVAAHPDDENTRLISWLALEKGYQTAYLSYTRGDGGQNLIGSEQAVELGMIRTQELLAARQIDGGQQYFSSACDFGFSKNPEETFSFWNRNKLLEETVWLIRKLRPDVIITRFSPEPSATHGHHTASAQLALEAFFASGDPEMFPEQLRKLDVWQPKRILWNTGWFFYGTRDYDKTGLLKVDVGTYIPLLGQSVGEIAAESRSRHRSQGFGSARQRGEEPEYFKLLAGDKPVADLMDGVETGWSRLQGSEKIETAFNTILRNFNPDAPAESVPALMDVRAELKKLNPSFWREIKIRQVEKLILDCTGFFAEALLSKPVFTPNDTIKLSIEYINRSRVPAFMGRCFVKDAGVLELNMPLQSNVLYKENRVLPPGTLKEYTNPFWLNEEKNSPGMFNAGLPEQAVKPSESDKFSAVLEVYFNNAADPIQITVPIVYKYTEPDRGELFRYPELVPPISIVAKTPLLIAKNGTQSVGELKLISNDERLKKGTLEFTTDHGVKVLTPSIDFEIQGEGSEKTFRFEVTGNSGRIFPKVKLDGNEYTRSIKRITYTHIPDLILQSRAEIRVSAPMVKNSALNVGYIEGAGDEIPQVLRALGYQVDLLKEDDLDFNLLKKYDVIIAGVRAYNTKGALGSKYEELMKYVQSGGKFIVQYNTSNGLLTDKMGPYPFKISRNRITVEEAPLEILNPSHPVFNKPNKISASDFEGWVQERGLYFAGETDDRYTKLLSGADPGEAASDGILLHTRYGKGQFFYTGLAFFRQLPAGNPGAIRLFVNLMECP